MWSKSNLLLWVSIKRSSKKGFSLPVPLPLFVVQEIFESIIDLVVIIHLFIPKRSMVEVQTNTHIQVFTVAQVNDLLSFLNQMLYALTECEPFDLVNVKTPEVEVIVKIR